jgi:hypothetical protein
MQTESVDREVARRSASIYLPIALGAAGLFFVASAGYPSVARIGGAVWVGLLSLIVSMPLVTARVKYRAGGKRPDSA